MLDVFTELDAEQQTVTAAEIARVCRDFKPPDSRATVIGKIENETAIRYYVLSIRYRALEHEAAHAVAFKCDTEAEIREHKRQIARRHSLHELALSAFWLQVRDDLDVDGSAWIPEGVGVREGWVLTAEPEEPKIRISRMKLPPGLADLLGGVSED